MNKIKQIVKRIVSDIKEYWVAAPIIFVLYLVTHKMMGAFCPSVWMTGFSCPGCGMTRAFLFTVTGQFRRAFEINPSIFLWIVLAIYFIIQRYIRGKTAKGVILFVGIIVVIMLLVYIYGMCTCFPTKPPYVYTPGNVFERYIPGYRELMQNLVNYAKR